MKLFFIEATRGCRCCQDDTHLLGPYRSEDDALRRVAYFLDPGSPFRPLSSHRGEASRGSYVVFTADVSASRWLSSDAGEDRVFGDPGFGDLGDAYDGDHHGDHHGNERREKTQSSGLSLKAACGKIIRPPQFISVGPFGDTAGDSYEWFEGSI